MELSNEVLGGLQLAGDQFRIPDKCFIKLVGNAMEELIHARQKNAGNIFDDQEFSSSDKGVLKQALYGLLTLFVEAAKTGVEMVVLQSVLDDCKISPERSGIITELYQKNQLLLSKDLENYTFHLQRVVDVDWKLDYSIMNNVVGKINQPTYTVELKTQSSSSGSLESEVFTCTVEELQDLVGKLKDAVKCWSKKAENQTT